MIATSAESCVWANGCLAMRYGMGEGSVWRGVSYDSWIDRGFSSFQAVTTDGGRPNPFCGHSCNTPSKWSGYNGWMCDSAYETAWGKYLLALQQYFTDQGFYADSKTKGFWYTQNEPQNWHDYTISAYLCSVARASAPNLKIMLSREAQPDIAERPDFDYCSYDIWTAHIWRYNPSYTWYRQSLGETSWFYTLDTDNECASPGVCNTVLAPAVSNTGDNGAEDPVALNDGLHYRVIPWVAWANRVEGWGYYKDDIFWDKRQADPAPARPRISAALLREGLEDYEYLWLANGGSKPKVWEKVSVDDSVIGVGFAVGVWQTNPTALHVMRHELGRKIEGTRTDFPYLASPSNRPFGDYNIDFQITFSNSTHTPFAFNGTSWIPIGYDIYNVSNGFGWNSRYMNVPNTIDPGNPILHCAYDQWRGDTLTSTFCYDDYNHPDEFHFQIEPGTYYVTVGLGWPEVCRHDTEFISINNVVLRNYSCNPTCCSGVREYGANVVVLPSANGGDLIMIVGNNDGYTILNYLKIHAVSTALSTSESISSSESMSVSTSSSSTSVSSSTSNSRSTSTSTSTSLSGSRSRSESTSTSQSSTGESTSTTGSMSRSTSTSTTPSASTSTSTTPSTSTSTSTTKSTSTSASASTTQSTSASKSHSHSKSESESTSEGESESASEGGSESESESESDSESYEESGSISTTESTSTTTSTSTSHTTSSNSRESSSEHEVSDISVSTGSTAIPHVLLYLPLLLLSLVKI
ncbi:hypothetical protein Pelo_5048 [Pelomyxa schiedti]|nr:hypothetical protein Pelo_5048 [Pelomyxa schiedti]